VSAASASHRFQWVDYARGVAILLAVNTHTMAGVQGSDLPLPEPFGTYYYVGITCFIMPLFFLLSGLFARRSLDRGLWPYTQGKLWGILYPYVLWSIIQTAARATLGGYANQPMTLERVASIAWDPIQQLWFLYVLMFCFLLYVLLARLPLWLHLAVALALHLGQTGFHLVILNKCLGHYIYFAAGVALAAKAASIMERMTPRQALSVVALFSLACAHYMWVMVTPLRIETHPVVGVYPQWAHVAFLGSFATIAACEMLDRWRPQAWLVYLGRLSLPIYLAHLIATASTRVVLEQFLGLYDVTLHIVLGTAAGVVFSVLLYKFSERLGAERWFGFGSA
jgi:fucose 4-O-acetylase-like acetyltransferase